jgi:vanillate/3-O-methylgallate O-demethylase
MPDKVLKDGKLVGISTTRGYSVYFRKMLSLCTLDVELCKPGTKVTVVWGRPDRKQKTIRAEVAPVPYKRDNRRIDVTKLPMKLLPP